MVPSGPSQHHWHGTVSWVSPLVHGVLAAPEESMWSYMVKIGVPGIHEVPHHRDKVPGASTG